MRLCAVVQALESKEIVWHPMAEDEASINAIGAVLLVSHVSKLDLLTFA